ncbi:hypothetical protein BuS5_01408 [Desulfosarcina sp. BuS5]|uniref:DVU0524 family FlgM-associated protein n=1 Tax=Desulfosarcina sp. BuS5 TaxID=933262 RepID=UPI0004821EBD|nr:DVU0524 family FlgM-associated protein [Desulfosarcina sp. BuS5]WDN88440.1 hypothetical protein BuS5_01408 [Desulfosarcina sp. BuS5]
MHIPGYQMRNVLNIYTRQLRNNKKSAKEKQHNREMTFDRISISAAGKQKAILEKITSNIVKKIFNFNFDKYMEYNVTAHPRGELSGNVSVENNDNKKLVFHTIDSNNIKYRETLEINESDFLVEDV